MMSTPNPTLQRRRLRTELRRCRQEAALTQEQVCTALDWSISKLIRIESGSIAISSIDLRALLALFRIKDPAYIDELLELGRGARERTWWSKYHDFLTKADLTYLEYESSATIISMFHVMVIPKLLQVEDYARALFSAGMQMPSDQVDGRIAVLREQQALLERADPPQLRIILDEAVIRRLVGDPETMRRQLEHLLEMARRQSNVHLQVLPFEAGAISAVQESFVHLDFLDDRDAMIWIENVDSRMRESDPERAMQYFESFMQLERLALDFGDSASILERMIEDLPLSSVKSRLTPSDSEDNLDQYFVL